MSKKQLKNPVTLTLELDSLHWLRGFLNAGRVSAAHDYDNVEALRSDLAISAAQEVLRSENAQMTKLVEAISKKLEVIDPHESPRGPHAAMMPPVA